MRPQVSPAQLRCGDSFSFPLSRLSSLSWFHHAAPVLEPRKRRRARHVPSRLETATNHCFRLSVTERTFITARPGFLVALSVMVSALG